MFFRMIAFFGALTLPSTAQIAQEVVTDSATRLVRVHEIRIKGSRLGEKSILHLTGLQVGQIIDDARLRTALQHANGSGLFKNIVYSYESLPDSTEVILDLQVDDELPLVPVTIKIPGVDSDNVWKYLENFDPFFTRELPPTEKAIDLYARYITKYVASLGETNVVVVGKALGSDQVKGILFSPVKLRQAGR